MIRNALLISGLLFTLYGYADNTPITTSYITASATFSEGLAAATQNDKWGYINPQQQWVIPAQYDAVQPYSHGIAAVAQNHHWGYIDTQGKQLVRPIYDKAYPFSADGYALVRQTGKFGIITRFGEVIVPLQYDQIVQRHSRHTTAHIAIKQGWITVGKRSSDNKTWHWGIYDTHGKPVIPPIYDNRDLHFANGLAAVRQNDKWGYVGYRGTVVIKQQYDAAKPFSQGYAAVKQHGKWGYINTQGEMVIPAQYAQADSFNGGIAHVVDTHQQSYLINLAGKRVP